MSRKILLLLPFGLFAQQSDLLGQNELKTVLSLSYGYYKESYEQPTQMEMDGMVFDLKSDKLLQIKDSSIIPFANEIENTRWLSLDPLADKYPSISPYVSMLNTPISAMDPDGRDVILLIWASHDGKTGHAGIAVANYKNQEQKVLENGKWVMKTVRVMDGTYTYHDLWPANEVKDKDFDKDAYPYYRIRSLTENQLTENDLGTDGASPDGVVRLTTTESKDNIVTIYLEAHKKVFRKYNGLTNNCADLCEEAIEYIAGKQLPVDEKMTESKSATTPNLLYKATITLENATILKDPKDKVDHTFLEAKGYGKLFDFIMK